jgi:hypothetical protein
MRFVTKEAPTVDCTFFASGAVGLTKRETSEVFPTPCAPKTTSFASIDVACMGCGAVVVIEGGARDIEPAEEILREGGK